MVILTEMRNFWTYWET